MPHRKEAKIKRLIQTIGKGALIEFWDEIQMLIEGDITKDQLLKHMIHIHPSWGEAPTRTRVNAALRLFTQFTDEEICDVLGM